MYTTRCGLYSRKQPLVPLHKSPDWAWSIWDNMLATLRVQVNAEAPRDARYASFLLHISPMESMNMLPGGSKKPEKRSLYQLTAWHEK